MITLKIFSFLTISKISGYFWIPKIWDLKQPEVPGRAKWEHADDQGPHHQAHSEGKCDLIVVCDNYSDNNGDSR